MNRISVVVLAAGEGVRMGEAKQLLPLRGQALVCHAAQAALGCACGTPVVVIGSRAQEVRTALAGLPVQVEENEAWEQGMGTSIHAGVRTALRLGARGVILTLADQPEVTEETLGRLLACRHASGKPIVASRYAGTLGVPVYFHEQLFEELLALPPASGCKRIIMSHPELCAEMSCPEAEHDIDTPSDYARLTAACRA